MSKAELKRRLSKGTKLTLVRNLLGHCAQKHRTVEVVQTNGVGMLQLDKPQPEHLSWFYFQPGARYVETPGGFEVHEDGKVSLGYKWGHV